MATDVADIVVFEGDSWIVPENIAGEDADAHRDFELPGGEGGIRTRGSTGRKQRRITAH